MAEHKVDLSSKLILVTGAFAAVSRPATSSSVAGRETAANAPDTVSSLESRNRCRMRRIYRKMMRRKYTSKSVTGAA